VSQLLHSVPLSSLMHFSATIFYVHGERKAPKEEPRTTSRYVSSLFTDGKRKWRVVPGCDVLSTHICPPYNEAIR
jgi:hypothetical protein